MAPRHPCYHPPAGGVHDAMRPAARHPMSAIRDLPDLLAPDPIPGLTVLEEGLTFVGDIVSEESIRVRGRIEGNIATSGSVVIEPRGAGLGEEVGRAPGR